MGSGQGINYCGAGNLETSLVLDKYNEEIEAGQIIALIASG